MDATVLRIIDANANRAREALRVLEEHARFGLEHAALAERIKWARHDLASALFGLPISALLAARDVAGDVGTTIWTSQEAIREGPRAVATAAARRAGEALRCIEEYSKTFDPALATRLESLRYATYEFEQAALLDGPAQLCIRTARLHVLLTESFCRRPWLDTAAAALDGGADVLQLREKSLPDAEWLRRAEALVELVRPRGRAVIINDRPDLARLVEADGVHVGQDDLPVASARRIAGSWRCVGKSTHTAEQLTAAIAEAPDYVAVGPMFASGTKPGSEIAGPALARAAFECMAALGVALPVVAIGGITTASAGALRDSGIRCVAVCQSVVAADDPARACRELLAAFS